MTSRTFTLKDFDIQRRGGDPLQLGKGAFSTVFSGLHKQSGKTFAIKICDLSLASAKSQYMDCLRREIDLHSKLDHPHIVRLMGHFVEDKKLHIVLEFLEGGNLFNYIRTKKKLKLEEGAKIFKQILQALQYLHSKDILHRDIKPENILLDKKGNAKLCDFGWSVMIEQENAQRDTFCGTLEYIAPEMYSGGTYNYKADVWAMGILFYEMLHGVSPFRGKSLVEISQNIKKGIIKFSPSIPTEYRGLIQGILQNDPRRRIEIGDILDSGVLDFPLTPYSGKRGSGNLSLYKDSTSKQKGSSSMIKKLKNKVKSKSKINKKTSNTNNITTTTTTNGLTISKKNNNPGTALFSKKMKFPRMMSPNAALHFTKNKKSKKIIGTSRSLCQNLDTKKHVYSGIGVNTLQLTKSKNGNFCIPIPAPGSLIRGHSSDKLKKIEGLQYSPRNLKSFKFKYRSLKSPAAVPSGSNNDFIKQALQMELQRKKQQNYLGREEIVEEGPVKMTQSIEKTSSHLLQNTYKRKKSYSMCQNSSKNYNSLKNVYAMPLEEPSTMEEGEGLEMEDWVGNCLVKKRKGDFQSVLDTYKKGRVEKSPEVNKKMTKTFSEMSPCFKLTSSTKKSIKKQLQKIKSKRSPSSRRGTASNLKNNLNRLTDQEIKISEVSSALLKQKSKKKNQGSSTLKSFSSFQSSVQQVGNRLKQSSKGGGATMRVIERTLLEQKENKGCFIPFKLENMKNYKTKNPSMTSPVHLQKNYSSQGLKLATNFSTTKIKNTQPLSTRPHILKNESFKQFSRFASPKNRVQGDLDGVQQPNENGSNLRSEIFRRLGMERGFSPSRRPQNISNANYQSVYSLSHSKNTSLSSKNLSQMVSNINNEISNTNNEINATTGDSSTKNKSKNNKIKNIYSAQKPKLNRIASSSSRQKINKEAMEVYGLHSMEFRTLSNVKQRKIQKPQLSVQNSYRNTAVKDYQQQQQQYKYQQAEGDISSYQNPLKNKDNCFNMQTPSLSSSKKVSMFKKYSDTFIVGGGDNKQDQFSKYASNFGEEMRQMRSASTKKMISKNGGSNNKHVFSSAQKRYHNNSTQMILQQNDSQMNINNNKTLNTSSKNYKKIKNSQFSGYLLESNNANLSSNTNSNSHLLKLKSTQKRLNIQNQYFSNSKRSQDIQDFSASKEASSYLKSGRRVRNENYRSEHSLLMDTSDKRWSSKKITIDQNSISIAESKTLYSFIKKRSCSINKNTGSFKNMAKFEEENFDNSRGGSKKIKNYTIEGSGWKLNSKLKNLLKENQEGSNGGVSIQIRQSSIA